MFPPKNLSHTYLLDHLNMYNPWKNISFLNMNDLFKMTIYSL
jgi:hypothetical protein